MSSLFSKPDIKPPKVMVPAVPQQDTAAEDYAGKLASKRSGFRKTVITGALEPTSRGKKTLLG